MDRHLGVPIASGRTAEVYAWDEGRVLKLFRPDFSHSDAEHEFGIAQAIDQCHLPSPRVFDLIDVDGRPGIVYERVEGVPMLRELKAQPWRARPLARLLAELHTQIHLRTATRLPRQRERLARCLRDAQLEGRQKDAIARRLALLPDGDYVCHGDFHPDNILLAASGPMIIDWTNAAVGNPLGDVMWTSLVLRMGDPPARGVMRWVIQFVRRLFHDAYRKRYIELNLDAREQLDQWALPIAVARLRDDIPDEREALLALIEHQVR